MPGPVAFPRGRTSRNLGAGTVVSHCVNAKPGFPKPLTSFALAFPAGVFTVSGLLSDGGSPDGRPVRLTNMVIVESA